MARNLIIVTCENLHNAQCSYSLFHFRELLVKESNHCGIIAFRIKGSLEQPLDVNCDLAFFAKLHFFSWNID